MRALSIRQPWAWLILHAGKDVENRTWRTSYRGPILIHAAQKGDSEQWYHLWHTRVNWNLPPLAEMGLGGFVGTATIVDCVTDSESVWFDGAYGFVLADVKPLPKFIPYRGRLGLFNVDDSVILPLDR